MTLAYTSEKWVVEGGGDCGSGLGKNVGAAEGVGEAKQSIYGEHGCLWRA